MIDINDYACVLQISEFDAVQTAVKENALISVLYVILDFYF